MQEEGVRCNWTQKATKTGMPHVALVVNGGEHWGALACPCSEKHAFALVIVDSVVYVPAPFGCWAWGICQREIKSGVISAAHHGGEVAKRIVGFDGFCIEGSCGGGEARRPGERFLQCLFMSRLRALRWKYWIVRMRFGRLSSDEALIRRCALACKWVCVLYLGKATE